MSSTQMERFERGGPANTPTNNGSSPQRFVIADLDGDHRCEIVGAGSTGLLEFYREDGTLYDSPKPTAFVQNHACGDVNGDGVPDVVLGDTVDVRVWDGATDTLSAGNFGIGAFHEVRIADIDGDGINDIVAATAAVAGVLERRRSISCDTTSLKSIPQCRSQPAPRTSTFYEQDSTTWTTTETSRYCSPGTSSSSFSIFRIQVRSLRLSNGGHTGRTTHVRLTFSVVRLQRRDSYEGTWITRGCSISTT